MASAISWECWDASSIPSPVQWVKDPALPQLQLTLQLFMPWRGQRTVQTGLRREPRKREKKKKKNPQNESMATLKQCKIKIRGIESKIVIFNVIVTSHVTSQWCH